MNKNLPQIFSYQQKQVRTVSKDGEPWFVASDVCKVLGIRNHHDAVTRLNDKMKDGVGVTDPHGRSQNTTVISEAGVYKLAFTSHKPEAEKFTDWVAIDVIPSIRKTGAYITSKADPQMLREKANQNEALADVNILAQTILPIYTAAGMKPQFQLLALKQLYQKANMELPVGDMTFDKELFDTEQIANKLGVFSARSGKPHAQAVLAIIARLNVSQDEKELVPYTRNGHSGTTYQYTVAVTDKVRKWLMENGYPTCIESVTSKVKRVYSVSYQRGITA